MVRVRELTKVAWISPPNHADAVLVHDPAVSLDGPRQLTAARAIHQETYDDSYADGGIEIRKVLGDIIL